MHSGQVSTPSFHGRDKRYLLVQGEQKHSLTQILMIPSE